jgi:hypothetical protein
MVRAMEQETSRALAAQGITSAATFTVEDGVILAGEERWAVAEVRAVSYDRDAALWNCRARLTWELVGQAHRGRVDFISTFADQGETHVVDGEARITAFGSETRYSF